MLLFFLLKILGNTFRSAIYDLLEQGFFMLSRQKNTVLWTWPKHWKAIPLSVYF